MDDAPHGRRDKRGDWRPSRLLAHPPVFVWPAQPLALLKWLFGYPGYILPWNLFHAAVGIVFWVYLTPSMDTVKPFSAGWIAFLLARNAFVVLLIYGALHLRLYVQRTHGTSFKFNGRRPATGNSAVPFGSQTIDNLIWTFASGVPVWTAFEAVAL